MSTRLNAKDTERCPFCVGCEAGFAPFRDLRQPQAAEGVGEQVKTAQWAVSTPRYPTKQGVEGAIYNCDAQRLCDWGGQ